MHKVVWKTSCVFKVKCAVSYICSWNGVFLCFILNSCRLSTHLAFRILKNFLHKRKAIASLLIWFISFQLQELKNSFCGWGLLSRTHDVILHRVAYKRDAEIETMRKIVWNSSKTTVNSSVYPSICIARVIVFRNIIVYIMFLSY